MGQIDAFRPISFWSGGSQDQQCGAQPTVDYIRGKMKVLDVCTKTGHLYEIMSGRLYGNFTGRYFNPYVRFVRKTVL